MAKNNKYVVGEIVKLKSGGPDMTVRSVPDDYGKSYECQWFAGKKLERGHFPEESIEKVEKKDGAS